MTADMLDPSVVDACARVGLSCKDAKLLRAHATGVYLLPHERIVARVSSRELSCDRVELSLKLTNWLADKGIPVTTPALDQVVNVGSSTVAFWNWYPQPGDRPDPAPRELGRILRRLHDLPPPPFDLPTYPPLQGLLEVLGSPSVLTEPEREWLSDRAAAILEGYRGLRSERGVGFVHGDAYPGNTLWGPSGALLGDWDEAAIAVRELDLVNTYHGARFGQTEAELREFTAAYGWDVRDWEGFPILRDMRDLHTLSAYIRRATRGDVAAEAELRLRVHFLRDPSLAGTRWHAVG